MKASTKWWIQAYCVGFTSAILLTRMTSCGTVPIDKVQQQALHAQESAAAQNSIEAASHFRVPPPSETLKVHTPDQAVTIAGRTSMVMGTTVELTRPAASEDSMSVKSDSSQHAGTKQDQTVASTVSVPFGLKLIMIGVGILLIVFALVYAWKYVKTTAFGAAISAGDSALSQVISHIQAQATTATDPNTVSRLQSVQAVAENVRGKLNNPVVTAP